MPLEYVRDLHSEVREEITRVDGKVATLLAVFGIAVFLVVGAMITRDADPRRLESAYLVAFAIAALLAISSLGLLVSALAPKVAHEEHSERVRYFGHVAQFPTLAMFEAALDGDLDPAERLTEQTHTLSRMVVAKYTRIRLAILLYGVAVAAALVAALGS